MIRRTFPFFVVAVLAVPEAARAAITLEAFYGLTQPPAADFSQAVSGTANNPDLIANSLNIAGGDLIVRLGFFELGAIIDTSWKSGSASQTAIGALAGVGGDVGGSFRLEALGELGGQRYGNFAENPDIVTSGSSDAWFMYVGLRPGIAYKFGEPGKSGLILGLWGFARWDLTTSTVPVTVGNAGSTSGGEVKLGGTTIGAQVRLGFDF